MSLRRARQPASGVLDDEDTVVEAIPLSFRLIGALAGGFILELAALGAYGRYLGGA